MSGGDGLGPSPLLSTSHPVWAIIGDRGLDFRASWISSVLERWIIDSRDPSQLAGVSRTARWTARTHKCSHFPQGTTFEKLDGVDGSCYSWQLA